jgi:tRNA(His) 5'-end guanylyltransferase
MKGYEAASDYTLVNRLPVILRLDGNSFSKFTKQRKFEKPFDQNFTNAMWETAKAVLKYCSGSQVAYVQSDEITVLLRNDLSLDTSPFLANRINKICSLVASTASVTFCNYLNKRKVEINESEEEASYVEAAFVEAVFDLRAFVVPPSEVNNVFLWRQQDAFKNCVSAVAWYGLGKKHGKKTAQKMLDGMNTNQRQEAIFKELNINMNDYPVKYKRGVCIYRENHEVPIESLIGIEKAIELNKVGEKVIRSNFTVDEHIPLFNQDPNFINKYLD